MTKSNAPLDPELKAEIDALSHERMARLVRFAPAGSKYFVAGPVADYFFERFRSLGGMTPALSKQIGWDG